MKARTARPGQAARRRKPEAGKWAIVALGANVGHSRRTILQAIRALQQLSDAPLRTSSLFRTDPVDCPPGSPKFVNAAVGLVPRPEETPESLLAKLQALEKEFGRATKKVLNEPRRLDLDLIAFADETRATKKLNLPHPRAQLRRFVLQPLSEIAPGLLLPGQSKTVSEFLRELPPEASKH